MIFEPLSIPGAVAIRMEPIVDERGHFARVFCEDEFREHGLDPRVVQSSVSFNVRAGTLRGLHYQAAPHGENKLIRCSRGVLWDVIVDLRPDSPAYCTWSGLTLRSDDDLMVYVPEGVAHGFVTLEDDSELHYQMSTCFEAASSRGVRWDDPAFGIEWPRGPAVLSDRDRDFPDFVR